MDTEQLPELRQDLELIEMDPDEDGAPTWMVYDIASHKYFLVGWLEFEILVRWGLGTASKIVQSVNKETTLHITQDNIEIIKRFIETHELVSAKSNESLLSLIHKRPKKHYFQKALHSYLFFLIPLISPDHFLERTLPLVKILFTKTAFIILCLIALTGFYLVARQWSEFIGTFDYLFTIENLLIFALCIILVKIFHELGHAYVAKYFGCRVSTIGIAFLVMWPVLYTDTTDVWKIKSKRQRVLVAAAGVLTELIIAILATFLWTFAPEGLSKTILFFLATISWFTSIFINFNPLLRFDGYYLLSDLIGIENLQTTAFTVGKWKLREVLFKFGEKAPILYPTKKEKLILFYAYFTWIWRFFLFISIALLVYFFFFKVLGIFLMAVEILYFILFPIFGELKSYWIRRKQVTMNKNTMITFSVLALLFILFFIPWHTQITAPATLEYTKQIKIFTQHEGQLKSTNFISGTAVKKGQLLMTFNNPNIDYNIRQVNIEIDIIQTRLRQEIDRTKELGFRQASLEELQSKKNELANLEEEKSKLKLYAPFSGKIFSDNQSIKPNVWIGKNQLIGELINASAPIIYAYVPEKDVHRIGVGAKANFYPNEIDNSKLKLKVTGIDPAAIENLASPYLASIYGGEIAVTLSEDKKLVVQEALYRITLEPINNIPLLSHVVTGEVVIKGKRESFAKRLWLLLSAILIRESGF